MVMVTVVMVAAAVVTVMLTVVAMIERGNSGGDSWDGNSGDGVDVGNSDDDGVFYGHCTLLFMDSNSIFALT